MFFPQPQSKISISGSHESLNESIFSRISSQNSGSNDFSYEEISFKIDICWMPQGCSEKKINSTTIKIPTTMKMMFLVLVF